ncbi:hypothetical protein RWH43_07800 [Microbacterium sp. KSW2-21]|uniref:Uncharacterized protein n=1 Tax=Microbacterium algihabitans TaxID=3075992 RepID=A0ABU3RUX8_9MICO|nr:hypothetical protein [Microbacterium sp. KSW2-21]MDU0326658.1 hypothetical protein [Microbacterium sp. KSW2-21]
MIARNRLHHRLGIGAAAAVLVFAAPAVSPASAAWETEATAAAPALTAGVLAAPVIGCATGGTVLAPTATLSWNTVARATGYRVTLTYPPTGATTVLVDRQTAASLRVDTGLLESVLGGLLTTLLGSTPSVVTVQALTDGAWVSVPSNGAPIAVTGLLQIGLLGGVKCQP